MGKSFYTTNNDTDLYTGSNNFSTRISADAESFGLTELDATQYAALNATYAASYLAVRALDTRDKVKVQAKENAKTALKLKASELAKIVEATITVTDEQKLALGLSVRATPTPVGDLNKPTDFSVTLEETGELILGFKATQPQGATGVTYQIWRKIDNASTWVCLGGCGNEKKFVDATVPAGSKVITYKLQAQRSTSKSPWAQFVVSFGVDMGETTIASIVETPAARIAA